MAGVRDGVFSLAADAFEWRSWHGEAVIYDALSGDTHRLAYPSGHVLDALRDEPGGAEAAHLSRRIGESAGTDAAPGDALAAALDALVELGIVEETGVDAR